MASTTKPFDQRIPPGRPLEPVRATTSPWWASVARRITEREDLRGKVVTVPDLMAVIGSFPDADPKRLRPSNTIRKLRNVLELVERGPNGSLSRGATYRVVVPKYENVPDEFANDEWLKRAADRMAGAEKKGKR